MWRTILGVSSSKQTGWMRIVPTLVLLHGCYGPNPSYWGEDASEEAGETDPTEGPGATSDDDNGPEADTHEGVGDAGNISDTADTDDASDSGDSGGVNCADDIAQPGELCFVVDTVLTVPVQSMAAGDFDLNGHLDLGVGSKDSLRVLFGDGSGGFPLEHDLHETDGEYWGATVGDLDGNGYPDLLFSNASVNAVMFHASQGNKTFADPIAFSTDQQPMGLSLALLNEDESLDVVVANRGSDDVSVLINEGGGMLGEAFDHSTDSDKPYQLVVGRFDPGPTLDLAVANRDGKELSILLGFGNGDFASAEVQSLTGTPRDLVAADFDLDGALDLALAIEDEDSVEVVFGDGFGGFEATQDEISVGDRPVALAVVDLDNDGALDLVVLNEDDADVGVLFGDLDQPGEFLAQQTLVGLSKFNNLAAILVADLNGDGLADLAVGGDELRTLISNP
jgi:hypothetical protein